MEHVGRSTGKYAINNESLTHNKEMKNLRALESISCFFFSGNLDIISKPVIKVYSFRKEYQSHVDSLWGIWLAKEILFLNKIINKIDYTWKIKRVGNFNPGEKHQL